VELLIPHPDNPRRGDVPAIMRSLERFGQVKPIIVQRSTNYVVAGNHTLQAAKELGWSSVDVQFMDLDDETARAYLIADNATADRATYDKGAKAKLYGTLLGDQMLVDMGIADEYEKLREELQEHPEKKRNKVEIDDVDLEEESEEVPDAPVPMREIPLRMPADELSEFSQKILDLQHLWELRTLVEIIKRSVDEAHDRWQAAARLGVGSADALPPELTSDY
jgi:ParB-like chromosome segregation protein Spo0J